MGPVNDPGSGRGSWPERPWTLPESARRVLASLVPVVCPPEVEDEGLVDRVVAHAALTIDALGRIQRAGLVAGIVSYDAGALLRHGRRAHALDRARGLAYFERWLALAGPPHELAMAIKGILCMAYYEMPEVLAAMGYHPEAWIHEVKKRRLALYSRDIERHERAILAPDPLPSRSRSP